MVEARYWYANFTASSTNFGNNIIDYATKLMISEILPEPAGELDIFTEQKVLPEIDYVVLPGCTNLTYPSSPGLHAFLKAEIPVYCLAGAIWSRLNESGVLLRNRIILARKSDEPSTEYARQMEEPVGVRDPFTYKLLLSQALPCIYAGCPTLLLPVDEVADDGYLLFSMGRYAVRRQVAMMKHLSRKHKVITVCHEKGEFEKIRCAGWKGPLVTFMGDVELYLSYFKRASVVVTGRLHGALPSIAYGKRVYYFGTRDSRTTLLDDLGIPIHGYGGIRHAGNIASAAANRELIDYFRATWTSMLESIRDKHSGSRQ